MSKIFSIETIGNYTRINCFGLKLYIPVKGKAEGPIYTLNEVKEFMRKYKYVHIMNNDKFSKPFVDFLNKYLNKEEHLILYFKKSKIHPIPKGDNVIEICNIFSLPLEYENIEKVVWHGLFSENWVKTLYEKPEVLKKSYWVVWGGDLYNAPRDEMHDFVRSNFKGFLSDVDKNVVVEKYNPIGKFYRMFYNFPISKKMLDKTRKNKSRRIRIQINNSCDESTLSMLDTLAKFKNENIKITTVLSYGKTEYKEAIIQKGQSIFGENFEYLDTYLAPEKYTKHLAKNDILILNQNRQQGFGNTLASLYLGQKVFIKNEVSLYNYLNNENIKIYDSNTIKDLNFSEFIKNSNSIENQNNVAKFFDENYLAKLLKEIFDDK